MNNELSVQPEAFEFDEMSGYGEFESPHGDYKTALGDAKAETAEWESGFGEFESAFGESETSGEQKNWYFFDVWSRLPDGSVNRLEKYGPRLETATDASRLFDTVCLKRQISSGGHGNGKVLARCYQWFPVSSTWVACKSVVGFKRGMCTSDESELGETGTFELQNEAAAPVFRFEPAGCAPFSAARSRAELRRAIRAGIELANKAAVKLTASPRHPETVRLFRFFYGHDPSRLVPWANNQQSGAGVAHRYRKVAEALQSRGTIYRCAPACTNANAFVDFQDHRNRVNLCPGFWTPPGGLRGLPPVQFRGAVLLHEMLHLLYNEFFHHPGHPSGDPVRRRDNSHCYEALALRLAGYGADHVDVRGCTGPATPP